MATLRKNILKKMKMHNHDYLVNMNHVPLNIYN